MFINFIDKILSQEIYSFAGALDILSSKYTFVVYMVIIFVVIGVLIAMVIKNDLKGATDVPQGAKKSSAELPVNPDSEDDDEEEE